MKLKMWQSILIGLFLGIAVGMYLNHYGNSGAEGAKESAKAIAEKLKIFGVVFINLIKMVVVPLIFFALVAGITSMDNAKDFKRIGVKGITSYLLTAVFAVILGLVFGVIYEPGVGLNIDISTLGDAAPVTDKPTPSVGSFLLDLISTNALRSMTEDHFLQVIIFAIFFGVVVNILGESVAGLKSGMQQLGKVFFRMVEYIVKLAPFAVFGFLSWMIAVQGYDVIWSLLKLVEAVLTACLVQMFVFALMISVFAKLNPIYFFKKIFTTQLMAFSTSSSKATLPTAMKEVQERLGVSERSTNFLLPLGACINMDGTAIYLGICAVFFAQMFGIELEFHDYLVLILTCTLGSIGAAGIPSGSIIFMGMVLTSVGIPMSAIALILGVDRILDMFRTTVNITGDCAITMIVDKTEGTMNTEVYYSDEKKKA
jgi:Na+/H+-dicarboxylate symporter